MTEDEILKAFNKNRKDEIRKIVIRPKFSLFKELFFVLVFLTIIILSICFHSVFTKPVFLFIIFAELTAFILTQTKNILLLLIFLYQKFAPAIIRKACLFTPSCSEYMRMCIIKYGVIRGVKKGFNRLKRCQPPNGGIDEP